jgi:DNA-binding IclR family transcriptional regulator
MKEPPVRTPKKAKEQPEEQRNVQRLVGLLASLSAAGGSGLRLADVVEATGLNKTTAHRLLSGLKAGGLVDYDEDRARYFVGIKMLAFASAARSRFDVVRCVGPALARLARQSEDTVYLVARLGDEIVCLDAAEGAFPIKALTLSVGDRRPLGIGAGSLAILAGLADGEVERIFETQAGMRASFPYDDLRLRQMVEATRENGYSYTDVHLFKGLEKVTEMAAIGMAIRRPAGDPVAALHLTAITSRLKPPRRENIVASMRREVELIERELAPLLATMDVQQRGRGAGAPV